MKKLYFRSLLGTLMLVCSAVLNAQDISVQYTGFEFQGIYYKFTGGTTVAVGEILTSGDIEIPEIVLCDLDFMEPYYTVTSIGEHAFENETGVTSVKIPNTVTSIGEHAFRECTSLTSITIPNSVTNIAYGAFYGCTGIKEVVIEDGDTELYLVESNSGGGGGHTPWHYGTFYDCPLESLYLGRNVSYPLPELRGDSPFSSQETLTSVTIGQNVTSIGKRLFERCTNLANITIPNSIKTIDDEAFEGCNILAEVIIPSSVTRIGNYAFSDCISLPSIAIPNSVTEIGGYAFASCVSLLSITIPNSVTEIGEYAFFRCESLNSVTMGNNVTRIGNWAFASCVSLPNITIPNSVTTIGDYAFSYCNALNNVTIGNGVTSMGEHAFADNNNLSAVYISDLSAWCKIDFYDNESTPLLYAHNLYVNSELLTDLVIPNDVTEIVNHAFQGCTSITSVTIPEGITRVGVAAFEWCSNLTGELVIPNSVKRIEGWAFSETKLTGIKWGNGLTYIGQCAFNRCYELAGNLVIPEGVEAIEGEAFFWCHSLTGELVIPNSVKTIGGGAFNDCHFTSMKMGSGVETMGDYTFGWMDSYIRDVYITDLSAWCKIYFSDSHSTPLNGGANLHLNGELLTDLVIPDDVTEIKQYAFYNCKSINTVDLGNVTSIGYHAFSDCDNLIGELVIPNSVTNMEHSAFYRCRNLAGVSIGDGVTELRSGTFYDCRNLKKITLGKNIETIDMNSNFDGWAVSSVTFNMNTVKDWFREFPGITEVHFGDNVQTITGGAFAHCDIDSVHIPAGVTSIEDYAFSWNQHLRKVTVAPENSVYHVDEEHHVMMETATDKVALAYQGATIPPYATAIGNGAFNGLLGITRLTIPESVESIGEWAFDGCSDLKKVINYSGLLLTKGSTDHGYVAYYADEVINITDIIDGYVFLTVEDVNYLMDYTGEATTLILPSDFKGESYIIAEGALKNKKAITSITLSDGVTAIADSAFAGCEALEELAILATVERIGKGITAGCNALAIITVDEENPTFDSREGCNAVISNTEYIASGDTTWVPTATPEAGKTYILECPLFYNAQGVRKALYNKNGSNGAWKTLDETDESFLWRVEATASGNVLKSVKDGRYLGPNWTMRSTPADCEFSIIQFEDNQVAISIGGRHLHANRHYNGSGEEGDIVSWETNSANSASAWVFTERKIDDISQLPNTLLLGCKTTVIPESVVAIGDVAFSGVEELQSITIPANVVAIGREAFKGCSNLVEIHVKATTPATIYSNTFADYSATLYVPVGTLSDYQAADYWKNFFNVATDDETLIEKVNSEETDDVIYDLMGRRVAESQKGGIYIVNGRKVVIK